MSPTIEVVDHVGLLGAEGPVRRLLQAVLESEKAKGDLAVALVDEPTIAELNSRYRGLDESTDVLSFAAEALTDGPEEMAAGGGSSSVWAPAAAVPDLGELVVCPAVVARYAREDARPAEVQLGWTLIHGTLHLLGYDHEADRGEMREREQQLLLALEPLVRALPTLAQTGTP